MLKLFNDVEFGCVYTMLYPGIQDGRGPILERAKSIAADPDFSCIELSWVKDGKKRKKLKNILNSAQMEVIYSQGIPAYAESLDINSLDDKKRKESVERSKELIDEARELGASIFQVIGGPDPGPENRSEARKYLTESLIELANYASKEPQIVINLEHMDRELDKKFFTGPTKETLPIIKDVRKESSNVGLTLDLAHLPLLNENPSESAKEAKPVINHVHLGNSVKRDSAHPRFGDTHPPIGIQGGEIGIDQLSSFLETLDDIGFLDNTNTDIMDKNIISFEVQTVKEQSPEIILATSKRSIKEAAYKVEQVN